MAQKNNRYKRQRVIISKMKKPHLGSFSFSDGIIVAIISFFSYCVVLIKKMFYFWEFKIPSEYLTLETADLILYGMYLIIIIFLYSFITSSFKTTIQHFLSNHGFDPNRKFYSTDAVIFFPFYIIMALFLLWDSWTYLLIPLGITFAILVLYDFLGKVRKKDKETLSKELCSEEIDPFDEIYKQSFSSVFYEEQWVTIFKMTFYGALILLVAASIGKYSAISAKEFRVLNINPECVVLFSNSEKMICSPFSRTSHEISPSYKVLYLQDTQNYEIKYENVGPLHLKPTPTPTLKPTLTPTVTRTPLPTNTPVPIQTNEIPPSQQ